MRGTLFPASNVIFAAQEQNPAKVPPAKDPALATDPLANTYGQWQAVENATLAIGETANLLMIPGRKCSSGIDVPLKNPDWAKFVQGLRDAALTAYKAAQSKDQDKTPMHPGPSPKPAPTVTTNIARKRIWLTVVSEESGPAR